MSRLLSQDTREKLSKLLQSQHQSSPVSFVPSEFLDSPETHPSVDAELDTDYEFSLALACSEGQMEQVRQFLHSQNVNEVSAEGETPLICAVGANNLDIARFILDHGADPDKCTPKTKFTALMEAAGEGMSAFVQLLLEHGAKVGIVNAAGNSALHCAAINGQLECVMLLVTAVEKGEEIRRVLNAPCDPPSVGKQAYFAAHSTSRSQAAALSNATDEAGNPITVAELLALPNEGGHNVLMEATSNGCFEVVKYLVEKGAVVNSQSHEFKESPLTMAAYKGHTVIAKYLIDHGADLEHRTDEMHTPLMEATMDGHIDTVKMLIQCGASVHMLPDSFESPLTIAASYGHTELVALYLAHGANIEGVNDEGFTALMEACREGYDQTAAYLLAMGADVNAITEENQETALSLACSTGFEKLVHLLIEHGANVDAGCTTPLMEAAQEGHLSIVISLLNAGANANLVCPPHHHHPQHQTTPTTTTTTTTSTPTPTTGSSNSGVGTVVGCGNQPANGVLVGDTALHLAVDGGHVDVARELLVRGSAWVEQPTEQGVTCLMKAAKAGRLEMVRLLVEVGHAQLDVCCGQQEQNALSFACAEAHFNVANYLLAKGADRKIRLKDGNNCYFEAVRSGSTEMVQLILGHIPISYDFLQTVSPLQVTSPPPPPPPPPPPSETDAAISFPPPALSAAAAPPPPPPVAITLPENHTCGEGCSVCANEAMKNFALCPSTSIEPTTTTTTTTTTSPLPHPSSPFDEHMLMRHVVDADDVDEETVVNFLAGSFSDIVDVDAAISFLCSPPPDILPVPVPVPPIVTPVNNTTAATSSCSPSTGVTLDNMPNLSTDDGLSGGDSAHATSITHSTNSTPSSSNLSEASAANSQSHLMTNVESIIQELLGLRPCTCVPLQESGNGESITSPTFHQQASQLLSSQEGRAATAAAFMLLEQHYREHHLAAQQGRQTSTAANGRLSPNSADNLDLSLASCTCCAASQAVNNLLLDSACDPLGMDSDSSKGIHSSPQQLRTVVATQLAAITAAAALTASGEQHMVALPPPTNTSQTPAAVAAIATPSVVATPSCPLKQMQQNHQLNKTLMEFRKSAFKLQQQQQSTTVPNATTNDSKEVSLPVSSATTSHSICNSLPTATTTTTPTCSGKASCASTCATATSIPPCPTTSAGKSKSSSTAAGISGPPPPPPPAAAATTATANTTSTNLMFDVNACLESTSENALHMACASGHTDVVRFLLEHGASCEQRDKKTGTPLHVAVVNNHLPVVQLLLTQVLDVDTPTERNKESALQIAANNGRLEIVEELLKRGANKEYRNSSDYTPLCLAASNGHLPVIKCLLRHGAEINSRSQSKLGISPLMLASMNGHLDTVRFLLDHGADVNAQIETNRNTALTLAAFQGRADVVKILAERRANLEHRAKTGLNPLMEAATGGYTEVGRVLIGFGADVNPVAGGPMKDVPLTLAADKGHTEFVKLLLTYGAYVEAKNKRGATALFLAASGGHTDCVTALLNHNACADTSDQRQITALIAAFRKGHVTVVKALLERVEHLPSTQDLNRHMVQIFEDATQECKEQIKQCVDLIERKREEKLRKADMHRDDLLEELAREDENKRRKNELAAKKREKKKERKRQKKMDKEKKQTTNTVLSALDEQRDHHHQMSSSPELITSQVGNNVQSSPEDEREHENNTKPIPINGFTSRSSASKKDENNAPHENVAVAHCQTFSSSSSNPVSTISSSLAHPQPPAVSDMKHEREENEMKEKDKTLANSRSKRSNKSTTTTTTTSNNPTTSHSSTPSSQRKRRSKVSSNATSATEVQHEEVCLSHSYTSASTMDHHHSTSTGSHEEQKAQVEYLTSVHTSHSVTHPPTQVVPTTIRKESLVESIHSSVISHIISKTHVSTASRDVKRHKVLFVPENCVGRVIGQGGSTVNALRQITSANIEISSEKDGDGQGNRQVTIRGRSDAVQQAEAYIQRLVEGKVTAKQVIELETQMETLKLTGGGGGLSVLGGSEVSSSASQHRSGKSLLSAVVTTTTSSKVRASNAAATVSGIAPKPLFPTTTLCSSTTLTSVTSMKTLPILTPVSMKSGLPSSSVWASSSSSTPASSKMKNFAHVAAEGVTNSFAASSTPLKTVRGGVASVTGRRADAPVPLMETNIDSQHDLSAEFPSLGTACSERRFSATDVPTSKVWTSSSVAPSTSTTAAVPVTSMVLLATKGTTQRGLTSTAAACEVVVSSSSSNKMPTSFASSGGIMRKAAVVTPIISNKLEAASLPRVPPMDYSVGEVVDNMLVGNEKPVPQSPEHSGLDTSAAALNANETENSLLSASSTRPFCKAPGSDRPFAQRQRKVVTSENTVLLPTPLATVPPFHRSFDATPSRVFKGSSELGIDSSGLLEHVGGSALFSATSPDQGAVILDVSRDLVLSPSGGDSASVPSEDSTLSAAANSSAAAAFGLFMHMVSSPNSSNHPEMALVAPTDSVSVRSHLSERENVTSTVAGENVLSSEQLSFVGGSGESQSSSHHISPAHSSCLPGSETTTAYGGQAPSWVAGNKLITQPNFTLHAVSSEPMPVLSSSAAMSPSFVAVTSNAVSSLHQPDLLTSSSVATVTTTATRFTATNGPVSQPQFPSPLFPSGFSASDSEEANFLLTNGILSREFQELSNGFPNNLLSSDLNTFADFVSQQQFPGNLLNHLVNQQQHQHHQQQHQHQHQQQQQRTLESSMFPPMSQQKTGGLHFLPNSVADPASLYQQPNIAFPGPNLHSPSQPFYRVPPPPPPPPSGPLAHHPPHPLGNVYGGATNFGGMKELLPSYPPPPPPPAAPSNAAFMDPHRGPPGSSHLPMYNPSTPPHNFWGMGSGTAEIMGNFPNQAAAASLMYATAPHNNAPVGYFHPGQNPPPQQSHLFPPGASLPPPQPPPSQPGPPGGAGYSSEMAAATQHLGLDCWRTAGAGGSQSSLGQPQQLPNPVNGGLHPHFSHLRAAAAIPHQLSAVHSHLFAYQDNHNK